MHCEKRILPAADLENLALSARGQPGHHPPPGAFLTIVQAREEPKDVQVREELWASLWKAFQRT